MRRLFLMAVFAIALLIPATANAHHAKHKTVCEKAYTARKHVVLMYSPEVAGRNICRFKMRGGMKPTYKQKVRYLTALRALTVQPYLLSVHPGAPRVYNAGPMTPHYKPEGLASCIAYAESSNNAHLLDQSAHTGLAQWSGEAWSRMGGTKYAPYPTGATYDQQALVLSYGLRVYGCNDWCPYDPC